MYSFKNRWCLLQLITFLSTVLISKAQVTIESCSDDIVTDVLPGTDGAAVTYPLPVVSSSTGNLILLTQPPPPGSFFPVGDTTVTYQYTNGFSSSLPCSFVITVQEVSPCDSASCQNGGLCLPLTTTEFSCACGGCFLGQFCETATLACATNPCNGGQCQPVESNCNIFQCQCQPCTFGQFCERSVDACLNNNCPVNSVCVPPDTGCDSYTCQCMGCFTGQFCQTAIPNPCDSFPCMNGGTCSRVQNICSSFQCSCPSGFTGDRCETALMVVPNSDPCNSFPCVNGVCTPEGSEYVCLCRQGYAGINCDTAVTDPNDRCSTVNCQNGGTCYNSYDSLSGTEVYAPQYCCVCAPGFGGQNCGINLNFGGNDQCAVSQGSRCSSVAQCSNKYNSFRGTDGYFCSCPLGLIGSDCSIQSFDPCAMNPCFNGVCMPFFTYFICECFPPFGGENCDIIPDTDPPVVQNCPGDFTVQETSEFTGFAVVSWDEPTAFDAMSEVIVTRTRAPGALIPYGTTVPVRYTFTDESGNSATCSFNVQVLEPQPNTPPLIPVCPSVSPVTSFLGNIGNFVSWSIDACIDAEDGSITPMCNPMSDSFFNFGTTEVTCTCTDSGGLSSECTFDAMVVTANTAPLMPVCPSVPPVAGLGNNIGNFITWTIGDCVDAEDGSITPVCNPMSGSFFNIGTMDVMCTCTDSGGLSSECSFIAVVDTPNTAPSVPVCPIVPDVNGLGENIGNFVDWNIEACTDAEEGSITPSCNPMSGSFFNFGMTSVTCTCTDSGGLSSECNFDVSVVTVNNPPAMPVCPSVPAVMSLTGGIGNFVSWTIGECMDDQDGSVTPVCNPLSGSFFNIGSTEVTCTCTDSAGLSSECTFSANVIVPSEPPTVVDCPDSSITQSVPFGAPSATVFWQEPSATSNTGGMVTVVQSHSPGDQFPIGETMVTYTFFDDLSQLTETCTFLVIVQVQVNDPPSTPVCPSVSPVDGFTESIGNFVLWTIEDCTDAQDGSITPMCDPMSGSFFNIGSTEVTCTCTDSGGVSSECSFDAVVVSPNTAPSVPVCPSVPDVNGLGENIGNFVDWNIGACTDVEDGSITPMCNPMSGSFFSFGTTSVTCTCTDSGGLSSECNFDVMVVSPNTAPVMPVCPTVPDVNGLGENIGNFVDWNILACTDAEDGSITPMCNPMSGSFFSFGTTSVTCTCTDSGGLSSECNFDVMVVSPNTAPVMPVCPTVPDVTSLPGNIGNFVDWNILACTDAEDGSITPMCNPMSGSFFNFGTTSVTCTCIDSGGLSSECNFDVEVGVANTAPSVPVCPNEPTVSSLFGNIGNFVDWTIGACTDAEDVSITPVCDPMSGSFFNFGTTSVTCTCTDSGGLSSECNFDAVVVPSNTAPSVPVCPSVPDVNGLGENIGNFVDWNIGACTDAEDGSITPSCNPMSGSFFNFGTTSVTCTCTDSGGLSSECSFDVMVVTANTAPSVPVCPSNPTANGLGENIGNFVDWNIGACTDAEDGSITPSCDPMSGSFFSFGTTSVTCTCTDSGGLSSECSFDVMVVSANTAPSVPVCPSNPTANGLGENIGNFVDWNIGACPDAEDGSITPMCNPMSGSFFSFGTTSVTCTCTDSGGLSSECSFDVMVVSANTAPSVPVCPSNPTANGLGENIGNFVDWNIGACPDAEDGSITPSCDPMSGSFFNFGTTSVTCTCTDSGGLSSECNFDVMVVSANTAPVMPVCPSNPTANGLGENIGNFVDWNIGACPDAEDGSITPMCNPMSGSFFNFGTTSVTCTCTDSGGLSSECSFDVTVGSANTAPSVPVCPSVPAVNGLGGNIGNFVSWTIEDCTDAEDGSITPMCNPMSDSFFNFGTTEVTCTCTDSGGLSSECSFDAIVGGNSPPPDPVCPVVEPVRSLTGDIGNFVSWTIPACFDSEDGPITPVCTPMSGSFFSLGTTPVTCTCTDSGGLSSQCSLNAEVSSANSPPPDPVCPMVQPVTSLAGDIGNIVSWNIPACFDSEDGPITPVCTPMSGSFFSLGTTPVTCTCTDSGGLSSQCSFNAEVSPAGQLMCLGVPDPIVRFVEPGVSGAVVSWVEPSCSSPLASITCSESSPQFILTGTTNAIVCSCTSGTNSVQCVFTAAVMTTGPVTLQVRNCPSTPIQVTPTSGSSTIPVVWSEPFALTNAGDQANVLSQTHSPGDSFNIPSVTQVTYVFEASGAMETCTFEVRVAQPASVTINQPCPNDFTTFADPGVASIPISWNPPTAVNENGVAVPVTFQSHSPGAQFSVPSTTTVTYVFTSGVATASCSFRITASTRIVPPTIINCPDDIQTTATPGPQVGVSWAPITAVTPTGQLGLQISATHESGDLFPVGKTDVTIVFADPSAPQSTTTCQFQVCVSAPPDPPTLISCPLDITQRASSLTVPVPVFWSPPTAVTAAGELALVSSQTHQSGDSFPIGVTPVLITLTDPIEFGQSIACNFQVTILPPLAPPTLVSCPSDITEISTTGAGVPVTYTPPTAITQNGQLATLISQSNFPGEVFAVGKTTVRYTFGDPSQPDSATTECVFCITIEVVLPNPPVLTFCPGLITTPSATGGSVAVSWDEPTAVSEGQLSTLLSQTHTSGSLFPVGITNVQYVFSDPSNTEVTSSCDFTVEVLGPPTLITCPGDITEVSPSGAGVIIMWDPPSAVTSQGTLATVQGQTHPSGNVFPVGVTCVEIILVDPASGLTVVCAFKITVFGPPVISGCPADQSVTSVQDTVSVTWVPPTAVSTLGIPLPATTTHTPGSAFQSPSTTMVMYSFTDPDSALTRQCVFTVTVIRPEPPTVIGCPTDIMMSAPGGQNVPVTITPPTAVSAGELVLCVSSQPVPPTFPVPTMTTIVYTCTDSQGLSVTCAFDVIITVELSPPTVTGCPSDIMLEGPQGASTVPVTWREPTAVTSSGLPAEMSSSFSPGDQFPVPTNVVVNYIFTDPLSDLQDNSCSFFIIITSPPPIEPPTVLGCPADVELDVDNAEMVAVSWAEPSATSNSPGGTVSITFTRVSGSNFVVPSTEEVVYTFTDSVNLLTSECRFTVTVTGEDTIPPTIENCPGNIVLTTNVNSPTLPVSWTVPTATDRGQPVAGMSNFDPGDVFGAGTSTGVLYRFTDAAGNENQCTFTISIIVQDIEPPVVSNCPEVISSTSTQQEEPQTWTEPTAVDNFGDFTVTQTHMPGDLFAVDTSTLVTYTFTDTAGNMAVCIFAVSVTSAPDDPPNIVFCPGPIMQVASPGAETLSVLWQEPQAEDDSGVPVGIIASHMPGDLFVVGATSMVIYTFTDNAGQASVCTFSVTVTAPADMNPPRVTNCPMSVSFERVATGSSIAVVDWEEPVATDQESVVTVVQTHTPPLSLPVGASVLVTYTFSDRSGNSALCSFTIFVLPADSNPPTFMNCPMDIRVPARVTDTETSAVGWLEPVASDAESEMVVVNVNFPPGTEFPIGSPVTVVYTATDGAAVPNTAECRFTVEVLPFDNVDPIILGCPAPVTESILPSFTLCSISWVPPFTMDVATFTSNFQPGDTFAADTTTEVIYTLTDGSGNTAMCDFTVTCVRDGDPPALQVPCPRLDIEMSVQPGISEVAIATLWPAPVAVEQFLPVTTTVTVVPDYPNFANGFLPVDGIRRQVQYNFADSLGNAQSCLFFVTLTEDTGPAPLPVFTSCPAIPLFRLSAQTGATASRTWPVVEAADPNGGTVTLTSTPANVDSFPVGATTVTITATNEEGGSRDCVFFVLVSADDTPPEAICPAVVMEVLPEGETTVAVMWNVEFTDNSGTVTVMQEGPRSGDSFGEGTSTAMYTATDEAGNVATCTVNIVVTADLGMDPTVTNCPSAFTAFTNNPSPQAVSFPPTEAEDANEITLLGVLTNPANNLFTPNNPPVPETVTFTFTDGAGRTATCMIELSFILDQTAPTFVTCPASGTVSATLSPGMSTVAVPTVQMISALDDSGMDPTVTTNPPDITSFPFGMTPVTMTAMDAAGNTQQCVFTVDVNAMPCEPNPCPSPLTEVCTPVLPQNTFTCAPDADEPILFNCPMMPIMATPLTGQNTVAVTNLPVVTATDNLDENLDMVSDVPSGSVFPAGTTTVTITFTDDAGNVATCMYDVIVADVVPPVIENCPTGPNPAIMETLLPGQDTVVVQELTVTDNLDNNPGVIRVPSSNVFTAGITGVSVTATDMAGNTATCSYNVEVSSPCDVILCNPPSACVNGAEGVTCGVSCDDATCNSPDNFCIEITPGVGICTGLTPECQANCPTPSDTLSCQAGRCIANPVTRTDCPQGCLVGQACVNGDCLLDSVDPVPVCPMMPVTATTPTSQQAATVVLPVITASDDLDPNPTVVLSPSGNQFGAGTTEVTATAIDNAGNMGTCTFNVVVTVDPCSPNPCLNGGTCTPDPADTFFCLCQPNFIGDTCEMEAIDQCTPTTCPTMGEFCFLQANVPTCVNIGTNPQLTDCPTTAYMVFTMTGTATFDVPIPSLTNFPAVAVTVTMSPSGNTFVAGNTPVTFTFMDDAGAAITVCTVDVTTIIPSGDTEAPMFTNCPNDPVTGSITGSAVLASVTIPEITVTDNVDPNPQLMQTPSGNMFQAGTTSVTVTATDASGNSNDCSFNVVVTINSCDNVLCDSPSTCALSQGIAVCVVSCAFATCNSAANNFCFEIPSSPGVGMCSGGLTAECQANCPVPSQGVSCQAGRCIADPVINCPQGCSAGEICSNGVCILPSGDTEAPMFTNCPNDPVTGSITGSAFLASVAIPQISVTDNVDPNPQLMQTPSGNMFQAGTTTVTVTATDASGNSNDCSFNVVVTINSCDNVLCDSPSTCALNQGIAACVVSCVDATCNPPENFCLDVSDSFGICTGDTAECLANCPMPSQGVSCQAGRCIADPVINCPQGCSAGEICSNRVCISDPCDPNPCMNGGNCNPSGTTFSCVCPAGFSGSMCEVEDPCTPDPCTGTDSCYVDFMGNAQCTSGSPCTGPVSPCTGACFPLPNNQFQCAGTGRKKRSITDLDDDSERLIFERMKIEVEKQMKGDALNREQPIVKEDNIVIGCSYYIAAFLAIACLVISFILSFYRRGSRDKVAKHEMQI